MLAALDGFDKVGQLLKTMDAKLGGALSAYEVLWNEFYRLVTTPPAKQKPPLSQDYPVLRPHRDHGRRSPRRPCALMESALAEAYEEGLVADAAVATSEAQRQEMWAIRDDVEQTTHFDPNFIFDVSMRLSKMEGYVEEVNRRLDATFGDYTNFTFGHIGDGNIHFAISAGDSEESAREGVERAVYEPLARYRRLGLCRTRRGIGEEAVPASFPHQRGSGADANAQASA